jgi:c-di-GMP-binding flagellar brake protein YcgR
MLADAENRREFLRIDHEVMIAYREVKGEALSNKSEILSRDISASGLLFRTKGIPPALSSIICLEVDEKMKSLCAEIEEELIAGDKGVLGRVVRISEGEPGESYDVGIAFLRRTQLSDDELCEVLTHIQG